MVHSPNAHQPFLVAVVGPTGTGKSELAIRLAESFKGEIVNADSRQVYRFMNIGTAKPTPDDMQRAPHHLFDLVNPDEDFSLGEYINLAKQAIENIHSKGRLPFLVGGTGQYVRAVLDGWCLPTVTPNPQLRDRLEREAAERGPEALHEELSRLDPAAAQTIDKRNVRRVIRAIEVSLTTGIRFSKLRQKQAPGFTPIVIGLTAERSKLYERLDARVEAMMRRGLVTECEGLLRRGYDFELPALNSVGYKQVGNYLKGQSSYEQAVQEIKYENHRLVRHQYAWFRLTDRGIQWFDTGSEITPEAMQLLANRLEQA